MRNLQKNLNIIWQAPISRQNSAPFCLILPFLAKISISINFEKVDPPLYERGGVRTMIPVVIILLHSYESKLVGLELKNDYYAVFVLLFEALQALNPFFLNSVLSRH